MLQKVFQRLARVDLGSAPEVHHDNCYVWELGRVILVVHVPLRQTA